MTRRLITILVLLCLTNVISCKAQKVQGIDAAIRNSGGRLSLYEGIYREKRPILIAWKLNKAKTADVSKIVVKYDASILLDSLSTDRIQDQVVTLIGSKMFESYGLWFWRESLSSTAYYSKGEEKDYFQKLLDDTGDRPRGYQMMINWFIYRDLSSKTVTSRHALPLRANAIEYSESLPKMTWSIYEETKEILGYECQKAETDFRGRHWTVWFAPEVPVDCGFWKFSGLPGLILEADSADDFYRYSAVSIENKAMDIQTYPMVETKTMNRDQFRKTESTIYGCPIPGGIFDQQKGQDYLIGGRVTVGEPKDTDTKIFTANNYLGLYFPMELE